MSFDLINNRTPMRLVKASLPFSLLNFLMEGITFDSILLFLVFTSSVYVSTQVARILFSEHLKMVPEIEDLKTQLAIFCALFVAISTFAYSWIFGVFYATIAIISFVSPYDRDWLLGQSRVVMVNNKFEYQQVDQ